MLHSTKNKKGTLYKRYLGVRDETEGNIFAEDEITSVVLGPLDFISNEDVFYFWAKLLGSAGHSVFLSETPPSSICMKMWDRRITEKGVVEPDVVVAMTWPDGRSNILLIEMKWRAPLSGKNKNQLHQQWNFYLNEQERKTALHILIAPHILEGVNAINEDDVWQGRLVLIPWLNVRTELGKLANCYSAIGRWALYADTFLERIGVFKFGGFKHFILDKPLPLLIPPTLFWCPKKSMGLVQPN